MWLSRGAFATLPSVGNSRRPEHRLLASVAIAAAYLSTGVAVFVLAPFIGTARVPSSLFRLILLVWALGLIILPSVGFANAKRAVLGAVIVVATFLVVAIAVSGGLRSPYGY